MRPILLAPILLAPILANCGGAEDAQSTASDDRVCALVKNAVVARGQYQEAHIAGCDGSAPNEDLNGYAVVRLNAYCREEICGSVLLGWYAVQLGSGRVFEWNVADWQLGPEINPASQPPHS
jgi:hypothetical protein